MDILIEVTRRVRIFTGSPINPAFRLALQRARAEVGELACTPTRCLRPVVQGDSNLCVAACAEMILEFFGAQGDQDQLARDLGLLSGTMSVALPDGEEQEVADLLQRREGRIAANIVSDISSFWDAVKTYIDLQTPIILFDNHHARIVSGYLRVSLEGRIIQGLSLVDPLDGSNLCWESFAEHRVKYKKLLVCDFADNP
jgi:hypothetical protein